MSKIPPYTGGEKHVHLFRKGKPVGILYELPSKVAAMLHNLGYVVNTSHDELLRVDFEVWRPRGRRRKTLTIIRESL